MNLSYTKYIQLLLHVQNKGRDLIALELIITKLKTTLHFTRNPYFLPNPRSPKPNYNYQIGYFSREGGERFASPFPAKTAGFWPE